MLQSVKLRLRPKNRGMPYSLIYSYMCPVSEKKLLQLKFRNMLYKRLFTNENVGCWSIVNICIVFRTSFQCISPCPLSPALYMVASAVATHKRKLSLTDLIYLWTTRRYILLCRKNSSICGRLWPSAKAFDVLWAKKEPFI